MGAGQGLGGITFPPPFLAPNSQQDYYTIQAGINYGSGSAGILVETGSVFVRWNNTFIFYSYLICLVICFADILYDMY